MGTEDPSRPGSKASRTFHLPLRNGNITRKTTARAQGKQGVLAPAAYLVAGVEAHVLVALLAVVVGVVGRVLGQPHPRRLAPHEQVLGLPGRPPVCREAQRHGAARAGEPLPPLTRTRAETLLWGGRRRTRVAPAHLGPAGTQRLRHNSLRGTHYRLSTRHVIREPVNVGSTFTRGLAT